MGSTRERGAAPSGGPPRAFPGPAGAAPRQRPLPFDAGALDARPVAPGRPTCDEERLWRARVSGPVAGVDEVGRGALAGPVVAAAVILAPDADGDGRLAAVDDSKRLAPEARMRAARDVMAAAHAVGIGAASPLEIDALGIAAATALAMRRALAALGRPVGLALVDGRPVAALRGVAHHAVVRGDARVLSIACASVVAKVSRDAWALRAGIDDGGYGLARHKGYGTPAHLAALALRGPSALHRRSWAPVAGAAAARAG